MISDESCDTGDCNDAENSVHHHKNKLHLKHIKIENSSFILKFNFTMLLFYCILDQVKYHY